MDAPRKMATGMLDSALAVRRALLVRAGVLLELGFKIDPTVLAALVAPAAGSLSGLDLREPLRLGAAAATGAVLAWFAGRG
jgi:hypothetical protein